MKVVTFGELMLRLAPEGYLRFVQSNKFEATFGGAEANVAVSLANYNQNVSFVSKLPNNEIGQMAINNELALNEMQSIGKACMLYGKVDTLEEMSRDIENVTAQELRDIANEVFADGALSYLYYV